VSEHDEIAAVLSGFQPLGDDNEHAVETMQSVRQMLEARNVEGELLETLTVDTSVIKPGDTLLLSCPANLTNQQVIEIKAQVEEKLPGVTVVVFGGGLTVQGVYRKEG
jgi:hypothetical protein